MEGESWHGFSEHEEAYVGLLADLTAATEMGLIEGAGEGDPMVQAMLQRLSEQGTLDESIAADLRKMTAIAARELDEVDDSVQQAVGGELEELVAIREGRQEPSEDWALAQQRLRVLREAVEEL